MKTYEYEELKDEKVFQELLAEVGKTQRGRWFTDSIDVDGFIDRVETKFYADVSRELYRIDNQTEEEIYEEQGDPAEIESYLEYELQSSVLIRIYGYETLERYDEEMKIYLSSLFNKHTRIMIG